MTVTPDDISRFRAIQKLAYRCVEAVQREVRVGMTERVVSEMMRRWLKDHGVSEYFHLPFAWFGDRTSFSGRWNHLKFAPTRRRLEPGMPVILDVGPSVDGYCADIGYGFCLGENPVWEKIQDDLKPYRDLILELVKQRRTARAIYLAVDALAARQGYETRHKAYPGQVLAHQVMRLPNNAGRRLFLGGLGLGAVQGIAGGIGAAQLFGKAEKWPLWNDRPESDVPVTEGFWAVEPHLGKGPVGSKWEEILVVTGNEAFWLDDEPPHVRRWNERNLPRTRYAPV